ncbi:MAG TPA: RidA family protein [Steroidobacteraceae bacterium]|jgi:enamine deaminase RidA (YjgF/YER057c/UK114 family)|nr:RidA family protein [Steroidobacteraceae bacterium]
MFSMNSGRKLVLAATVLVFAAAGSSAHAADSSKVVRLPLPDGNDFPISSAVTVKAGVDTYFLSGALAPVINKDAPKGSVAAYGDTETQTVGALNSIKATLARLGLTMGDVVKMTVFLVGDPAKDNKMDFAGMMAGYKQFFATAEQPNKPSRSAFQVAALAAPGALVEIEVVAAKAH